MVENEETQAPESDERQFARNMQKLREHRGWSQSELARKMVDAGWSNYNQMTVSRTEKGERPIRLSEARALAKVFTTTVERMTYSDERIDVGIAIKEAADAYFKLREATGAFLAAQNRLVTQAESAMALGQNMDREEIDEVEEWLTVLPESAINDSVDAWNSVRREDDWQEARHLGLSSLPELAEYRNREAAEAGYSSHEEYQDSQLSHMRFMSLLERMRRGEHQKEK